MNTTRQAAQEPPVMPPTEPVVSGFKGLDKAFQCRGFQYTVGQTFMNYQLADANALIAEAAASAKEFSDRANGKAYSFSYEAGVLRSVIRMLCAQAREERTPIGIARSIKALQPGGFEAVFTALFDRIDTETANDTSYGYISVLGHIESALYALRDAGHYDSDELYPARVSMRQRPRARA